MMQPGMQAGIGMGPPRPPQGMQGPPGMQAPPQGGPQMPPPQPGMGPQAGPQGTDPMAMMAQLKNAPDQQLQQMVQSKHPLGSFALVMLNGRNQQRKAAQAQQQQQIASQPPVAQRVMQEAQQLGGVAALPTGQAIPQQYAGGGIVKGYEDGGRVWYDKLTSMLGDFSRGQEADFRRENARLGEVAPTVPYELPPVKDWTAMDALRWMAQNKQDPAQENAMSRPPVDQTARFPVPGAALNPMNVAASQARPIGVAAPKQQPAPALGRARPEAPGTGIASLVAGKPGSGFPEWKSPLEGAPAARMTDAEFSAYVQQKFKELEALYGPDVAMKYVKEMQAEREAIKAREPRARQEAWLTAGLRMMQGKSRHGLQNIGAGGEAGIAQYRADRQDADRQMSVLRDKMMQAEAAAQQRKDSMIGMARQEGTLRNAQMGQDRAEYVGDKTAAQQHGIKALEYGLREREVGAKETSARADMARASAAATANGLVREANAITAMRGKIDAAVKNRVAAMQMQFIGKTQPQIDAMIDAIERSEYEKELNRNPKFAELMGVSGKGTISAGDVGLAGKK